MRLLFIVESGTDVRMVEGLARRFELRVLFRKIIGGVAVNWEPGLPADLIEGPSSRIRFGLRIWKELHRAKSDEVVLVQGYAVAALVANIAAQMRPCPTLMLVCSPIEVYYRSRKDSGDSTKPFRQREYAGLVALAWLNARLGSRYVVLSHYLEGLIRSHGWRGPIDVVPLYGVDVARFAPAPGRKSEIRRRLALPAQGKIILFSSRVAPEKDATTVLQALAELRHRRLAEEIWVVNRGGGFEEFLRLAKSFGVADRVLGGGPFHPQRELPQLYQAVDLCVQASREEGLGFSPLEALACGIPVVATDIGGLRETIVDGRTGWSYPRGDALGLARAIEDVFDRPEEAARRTELGRRMVIEQFGEAKVFDAFEGLVREFALRATARAPEAGLDARRSEPDLRE